MKKSLLIPLVLAESTLSAASPALPEFNSSAIGHPPLLLGDALKGPLTFKSHVFGETLPPHVAPVRATTSPRRVTRVGGMPVLAPDPSVDFKLNVHSPDPSVDFKMIVKPGDAEPAVK